MGEGRSELPPEASEAENRRALRSAAYLLQVAARLIESALLDVELVLALDRG